MKRGILVVLSIFVFGISLTLWAREFDKNYFRAQSRPEFTLKRYLEACRLHIKDPDLDIYTDQTKEFFSRWTVTDAQQDNMRIYEGVPFKIAIKGRYAVIYYPQDLKYAPFFLRKGPKGWQLDFVTMSEVIRVSQSGQWHFVSFDHPYMFAFEKYYIDDNGFVWFGGKARRHR